MPTSLNNKLFGGLALVIAILAWMTSFPILGGFSNSKVGPGRGKVATVTLGIYWNEACSNATTAVNWGVVSPGASKNVTLYVRNEGQYTTKLNMTTLNWNPASALTYVTLTWNREGQILNPQEVFGATLILSISANISGITVFSFNTIIASVTH